MNKHLFLLGVIALSMTACGPVYVVHQDPPPPPPPPAEAPAPEDVTYQTFYDQLSPYGQWVEMPDYGYVWLPDAGPDFKPYATNGSWVYTDEGWAWNSGYPWGWATFHYGRWFFQDGYGWMWMPGNEWAPAWVEWRNSDDYYGWAPLAPNISFNMAIGGGYAPPSHYWCFVPHQYVGSPQMNNYYVRETNNVTIINRTTIINNTTVVNRPRNNHYGVGPDPTDVGRFSGRPVRPVAVRESRNPGDRGNGNDFAVYRPRVNAAPAGDNRPGVARPGRVQPLNNARPVNRNSYSNNGDPGRGNDDRGGRGNNGDPGRGNNADPGRGNNGDRGNSDNRDRGNNDNRGNNGGNNQPVRTSPGFPNRPGSQPAQGGNQPVNNPPANQPVYNRPVNNPPANNVPASNPPVNNVPANNPPANNPPVNRPPFNRPVTRPAGVQPANNPPANTPPANNTPAGQPQQIRNRPGTPAVRTVSQPDNNHPARPVVNQPRPAPVQQHNPPPQRRDEPKKDNRP